MPGHPGFVSSSVADTLDGDAFRQVLLTGERMQVVAMSIAPGEDIGLAVHEDHDQVLIFVEGNEAVSPGTVKKTATRQDSIEALQVSGAACFAG